MIFQSHIAQQAMMNEVSAGGDTLYDLIMADIGTYGGVYLRLGEASGTTAENEAGTPEGVYEGTTYSLGNAALYTGGPTSFRTQSNNSAARWLEQALPTVNAMTLGIIVKPAAFSGVRQLITRDATNRYWQWRLSGTNLQFTKIVGGIQGGDYSTSMSDGNTYFLAATVSSAGFLKQFVDGAKAGETEMSPANYGGNAGTGAYVTVGRRSGSSDATDNYFSEAFLLYGDVSEARIAEYATATGL